MREMEEIVAIAPQFNLDGVTRTTGVLFFTDQRVVFVKTSKKSDVAKALFGVLGAWLIERQSRKASQAVQSMSLKELLASPYEKAMFAYSELQSLSIRPRRLLSSRVIVRPRNGKKKKFWGKRRDLMAVVKIADRLKALGAPVEAC